MSQLPPSLFKFDFTPSSSLRRTCQAACLWADEVCHKATKPDLKSLSRKLQGQEKLSLSWPEALMLRDCLKLHREERMAPDSPLVNDVRFLENSISDRDATVLRSLKDEKTTWVRIRGGLSEAEKEERSYREKRDAIFREMVGNPAKLNIWGFEEKDEPKVEKYDLTGLNEKPVPETSFEGGSLVSSGFATGNTTGGTNPTITAENEWRRQTKPVAFPMQTEFSTPAVGKRFVVFDEKGPLDPEKSEKVLSNPMIQYLIQDLEDHLKDVGTEKK